ncbi:uncharacterized protein TNCV_2182021 [Trichonephila clavipes]|uniref:Uncharacterized protein n=1 Tax=Trichonephila clavipes TaxID=2585209 RepID=A0A8X7B897_TRICX|nr:uncharacterized protein TNCV_2181991 [Trichonephila clavipes]GFY22941.1 uncharacterized protein TNCV_2182021 [Trichonephila clavipes]
MFDSSSYVNPTPLAHADTSRDILPRGGTSQWRPTRCNLYDPEMRNTRGFNVWPEVYFSGSENVTEFLEGIDNRIKLLEIPSDLSCAYLKGHGLVPNIRIDVSAKYCHGLRTAESSIVKSIPCHPK